ncbi:MAG: sel1 repeat family protein [Rhodanobacteraceae bacterium]
MYRSILFVSLGAALLATASMAAAATAQPATPVSAASSATPPAPVVARPKDSAEVDRIITAMNNSSTWGHPDLFGEYAGMRLYSEGHYKAAIKYFNYGARYADKLSQLSIGLMYENGHGVEKDPVTACAWLALAAQRKYPSFVATRNRVCEALTPAQHDQAVAVLDKLLPEYGDKVAKKRMVMALNLAKMETTGSRLGFDSGIDTVGVNQNCGGPTVGGAPQSGCGSNNFWSPWRWNPKQYFATRDAQWSGTVSLGTLQQMNAPASGTQQPADKTPPAPASSAGH